MSALFELLRPQIATRRSEARLTRAPFLSPVSGLTGIAASHTSPAQRRWREFRFPDQTETGDGGIRPGTREMLRFVSFVPHSLPSFPVARAGWCSQDIFS